MLSYKRSPILLLGFIELSMILLILILMMMLTFLAIAAVAPYKFIATIKKNLKKQFIWWQHYTITGSTWLLWSVPCLSGSSESSPTWASLALGSVTAAASDKPHTIFILPLIRNPSHAFSRVAFFEHQNLFSDNVCSGSGQNQVPFRRTEPGHGTESGFQNRVVCT